MSSSGYCFSADRCPGYTQSGPLFHSKSRALEKLLIKVFPSSTLHYPTGPIPLRPSDIPGFVPSVTASELDNETDSYGWWRRKDGTTIYEGIEKGLARVAETIRLEGPFDGAIGFSQGGALAAMIASLLETDRRHAFDALCARKSDKFPYPTSFIGKNGEPLQEPLKFAIIYSGFAAPFETYEGFYNPKIKTPVLHFLGSLDTVVEEKRSRLLIDSCEDTDENILVHPGGHFLPSQKIWLDGAVAFIRKSMGGGNSKTNKLEENIEDIELPF